MTNAKDALPDKIAVEPSNDADVNAGVGGPVDIPEDAADAWAAVLIDIHEKRERMAGDDSVNTGPESPSHD